MMYWVGLGRVQWDHEDEGGRGKTAAQCFSLGALGKWGRRSLRQDWELAGLGLRWPQFDRLSLRPSKCLEPRKRGWAWKR